MDQMEEVHSFRHQYPPKSQAGSAAVLFPACVQGGQYLQQNDNDTNTHEMDGRNEKMNEKINEKTNEKTNEMMDERKDKMNYFFGMNPK